MSLFTPQEIVIALATAALAQLGFVGLFSMPQPEMVKMDISDENARPIAVAITPVPLLKQGSKTPSKLPSQWQRKKPVAAKSEGPLPSPQAEQTPDAIPKSPMPDAAVAPNVVDAATTTTPDLSTAADAAPTTVASSEGAPEGVPTGTETDPLKARAISLYRAQLAAWFLSRFAIRGKIPFDQLQKLHALAVVQITAERRVGGFTLTSPSGDATFDGEVKATLSRIQSGGAELPAPPPLYPDVLGQSLPVSFQCTIRSQCE
jgi:hypothetical protein